MMMTKKKMKMNMNMNMEWCAGPWNHVKLYPDHSHYASLYGSHGSVNRSARTHDNHHQNHDVAKPKHNVRQRSRSSCKSNCGRLFRCLGNVCNKNDDTNAPFCSIMLNGCSFGSSDNLVFSSNSRTQLDASHGRRSRHGESHRNVCLLSEHLRSPCAAAAAAPATDSMWPPRLHTKPYKYSSFLSA